MSHDFRVTGEYEGTGMYVKPCHFCGNAVSLYRETYFGYFLVRCSALGCYASGPQRQTEKSAVKSWNEMCLIEVDSDD